MDNYINISFFTGFVKSKLFTKVWDNVLKTRAGDEFIYYFGNNGVFNKTKVNLLSDSDAIIKHNTLVEKIKNFKPPYGPSTRAYGVKKNFRRVIQPKYNSEKEEWVFTKRKEDEVLEFDIILGSGRELEAFFIPVVVSLIHEMQHVRIMQDYENYYKVINIAPYHQHKLMKDVRKKYYKERLQAVDLLYPERDKSKDHGLINKFAD